MKFGLEQRSDWVVDPGAWFMRLWVAERKLGQWVLNGVKYLACLSPECKIY